MKIPGQLEQAQLENLTADPSNLPEGRAWLNTTANKAKVVISSAAHSVVTEDQTQTLTNKTLTSPAINSPTGLVKADVGLSNVDNTSDATKNSAVATLTNKTIDAASNTISNISNAEIKSGANISYSKMAALTASKAMVTDGSGVATASTVTATELGYVSGVTSAIQTQINSLVTSNVPTGSVTMYVGSSAPTGWLILDGSSIGNASSGATSRANADTETLFTLLWNSMSNTDLPIQTSAGANTTRGASAAADFAANKRMPLPDTRGVFVRGNGSQTISAVTYSATLGTKQGDTFQSHTHSTSESPHVHNQLIPASPGANVFSLQNGNYDPASASATAFNTAGATTGLTVGSPNTGRTGTETRPANIALNYIIKN